MKRRLIGAVAAALLTPSAVAVYAAEEPAQDTSGVIEEILVTTKRGAAQNVQDMSEAVSAFSGEALERMFASTLEDFNTSVPNVQLEHVSLFNAAASFNMRGVGTAGIESFADPVVAVFVDDAYYSRNAVALLHLFDVESVTALRGPQGILYGRNAFGGAISVRTNRAQIDELNGELHAEVGNAGKRRFGGVGNVPLIEDKLAFRIAANYNELDGFFKNDGIILESYNRATATLRTRVDEDKKGDRENGFRSVYVRPSLRFEPNDALRIDVIGEIWQDKGDGTANWTQCYQPGSLPPPLGNGLSGRRAVHQAFGFPCKDPFGDARFDIPGDGSDPYEVGFNLSPNQTDQDIWSVTVDASYNTDIGTFTMIYSHRDEEEDITTDTDGYNWDVFSSTRLQDFKSDQLELRYNYTFNDNVEVVAGAFLFRDEYTVEQYLWIFLDSQLFGGGGFSRENPFLSWGTNGQERNTWATYAQVDWHLTDQWTLSVGGRYAYEKKDDVLGMAINDSNCPPGRNPRQTPRPACNGVPFAGTDPTDVQDFDPIVRFGPVNEDWKAFSPRLAVEYQPSDDLLVFAFWQRAFKSGGFVNNAGTLPVFSSPYDQEQVDNYEAGIKSEWWDNRLQINANVFYSEYKDLQRSVIRAAPTSTGQETFTDNAAGAEAVGVELQFSFLPIENLNLYGNIGWLDIEYKSFIADLLGNGIPTDNSHLDLVRAPKWDLNLGARYDFPETAIGNFSAMVGYAYTSKMVLTTPNDVGFDRRPLGVWDAQINWESVDGRYTATLWGKNLNDDVERLGGTTVATLFAFAAPTQPRQYGFTVKMMLGE